MKAGALFIPIRQVAQPSVGSCIVLIICVMLSDVNLHYLTLAARCPVSGCWPLVNVFLSPNQQCLNTLGNSDHSVLSERITHASSLIIHSCWSGDRKGIRPTKTCSNYHQRSSSEDLVKHEVTPKNKTG